MALSLKQLLDKTEHYQDKRMFFFHGDLQAIMKELLTGKTYNTETQPLGELLKQLSDVELFCYVWKDTYLRAYVFDREDQRIELTKAYNLAKMVCENEQLKKFYIDNHDDFVKNEYYKLNGNIMENILANV